MAKEKKMLLVRYCDECYFLDRPDTGREKQDYYCFFGDTIISASKTHTMPGNCPLRKADFTVRTDKI